MEIGEGFHWKRLGLIAIAAVVLCTSAVRADDLNPPAYAGLDNHTVAFWNEQTPGEGDLALDPSLGVSGTGFDFFGTAYPLNNEDMGAGTGVPALDIVQDIDGDTHSFWQPNFEDPFNFKLVRIQVTSQRSIAGRLGHSRFSSGGHGCR